MVVFFRIPNRGKDLVSQQLILGLRCGVSLSGFPSQNRDLLLLQLTQVNVLQREAGLQQVTKTNQKTC